MELIGDSGSYCIVRNENGRHILMPRKGFQIIDISANKRTGPETKKPSLGDDSSSSASDDSSDIKESTGLKVLQVNTTEDIHKGFAKAKGGSILVASHEEAEEAQAGLKYLGRGL